MRTSSLYTGITNPNAYLPPLSKSSLLLNHFLASKIVSWIHLQYINTIPHTELKFQTYMHSNRNTHIFKMLLCIGLPYWHWCVFITDTNPVLQCVPYCIVYNITFFFIFPFFCFQSAIIGLTVYKSMYVHHCFVAWKPLMHKAMSMRRHKGIFEYWSRRLYCIKDIYSGLEII
jgi:hypothetical protein